jgi:hypothetical protein
MSKGIDYVVEDKGYINVKRRTAEEISEIPPEKRTAADLAEAHAIMNDGYFDFILELDLWSEKILKTIEKRGEEWNMEETENLIKMIAKQILMSHEMTLCLENFLTYKIKEKTFIDKMREIMRGFEGQL